MKMKMIMENRSHKQDIDLDVDIETNIQNIAYLGKAMLLCNKQLLIKKHRRLNSLKS